MNWVEIVISKHLYSYEHFVTLDRSGARGKYGLQFGTAVVMMSNNNALLDMF